MTRVTASLKTARPLEEGVGSGWWHKVPIYMTESVQEVEATIIGTQAHPRYGLPLERMQKPKLCWCSGLGGG